MGTDQLTGLLRAVLAAAAGYVAAKGWIPLDYANEIAGAVLTVAVAVWSWKTNAPGKTVS